MTKQTDYLIIGSGIAGLATALHLSEFGQVTVVTKGEARSANTYLAQGGVAAVKTQEDSFESHIQDTLQVGMGHCNEEAVKMMVQAAPKAIRFLEELGLKFDPEPFLEAGHSHPRIWHTSDFTGRDILEALLKAVNKNKSIQVIEKTDVVELIVEKGECLGGFIRHVEAANAPVEKLAAKHTILATGGLGQLFGRTTNTLGSGGDGLALAVNAGLELKDLEFVQFHPTALAMPEEGRHFLLSETLRGMGAKVVNAAGEPFLMKYDQRAELAPRDLVSRAIHIEEVTGPVYLDMRELPSAEVKKKFPNIYQALKRHRLDPATDLIPITPVAHFACGGVPTDLKGATQLPGLYAVGEVACTGVHGANRLASNSLLESLVFAKHIAESLEKMLPLNKENNVEIEALEVPTVIVEDWQQVKAYAARIGKIMWDHVGIVRTPSGLEQAKKEIVAIPARDYRIQHRQLVCYKIIEACQNRPESLGTHFMTNDIV